MYYILIVGPLKFGIILVERSETYLHSPLSNGPINICFSLAYGALPQNGAPGLKISFLISQLKHMLWVHLIYLS